MGVGAGSGLLMLRRTQCRALKAARYLRREVAARVMSFLLAASLAISMILSVHAETRDEWVREPVPLLTLPDGPIRLRVLYIENPRFAPVSDRAIAIILAEAHASVKAHFGVEIQFGPTDKAQIETVFARIPQADIRLGRRSIFDFKTGSPSKESFERLAKANFYGLKRSSSSLDDLLKFAVPHLHPRLRERLLQDDGRPNHWQLALAATYQMLSRLKFVAGNTLADGGPAIDETPYNEWVYWDLLGNSGLPQEVVITNQLVASAEYYGASLHSALRGGVTAGTTSANRLSEFGTYSWVSLFPFAAVGSQIRALRFDQNYWYDDEAEKLAGVLLAHELGHQLFHFGHPFGNSACLMAPSPTLAFRLWRKGLDPSKCKIGGSPQMTPGAAKLFFMRARE